jgi:glycosyltransferase involved in cell wall biosynthesis
MDRIIFADQSCWADENSPESLANAIEALSKTDLEAAGAKASRRVTNRYAWGSVFERMFSTYQNVAASKT